MEDGNASSTHADRLLQLSQCGPDTDMGRLLRRFWHPVAVSGHLSSGQAIPIKILDEELTLYRGESGRPYLVESRCAHRRTVLHTGWVQGEEIRCVYHGWKYDGTGQCTEAPAEGPETASKIRISGYPTYEYSSLIFAYMGPGDPPEFDLPRKEALETEHVVAFGRQEIWPCNWFQLVENSMDAVHVSFVHHAGKVGPFGEAVTQAIPSLDYLETDAGIRQFATRGKDNVRISDWTFPNYNHIVIPGLKDDPWIDTCVWRVPIDEHHTLRLGIYALNTDDAAARERFADFFGQYGTYDPARHHEELMFNSAFPEDRIIQLTSAQDYVAALGQGVLTDRTAERLGKSDKGIVFLRRLFRREMEALKTGMSIKNWTRLRQQKDVPLQTLANAVKD